MAAAKTLASFVLGPHPPRSHSAADQRADGVNEVGPVSLVERTVDGNSVCGRRALTGGDDGASQPGR